MSKCVKCGGELAPGQRFCVNCGTPVAETPSAVAGPPFTPEPPSSPSPANWAPAQGSAMVQPASCLGAPGIGVAGFILSLLGVSIIGLILSIMGYRQAVREGRPKGLCLAGIILGALGIIATIIVVILAVVAANSAPSYYGN